MEQFFCQSCGMPMGDTDDLYGTNADGGKNDDYCCYCYQKGAFTYEGSMENMIEMCVPHMTAAHPEMTDEKARAMMLEYFPMLKRWKQS